MEMLEAISNAGLGGVIARESSPLITFRISCSDRAPEITKTNNDPRGKYRVRQFLKIEEVDLLNLNISDMAASDWKVITKGEQ